MSKWRRWLIILLAGKRMVVLNTRFDIPYAGVGGKAVRFTEYRWGGGIWHGNTTNGTSTDNVRIYPSNQARGGGNV